MIELQKNEPKSLKSSPGAQNCTRPGDVNWGRSGNPPMRPLPRPAGRARSAWRGFAGSRLAVAALLACLVGCTPAAADERVKFVSAGQGEPIQGYLTRPKGAGPFPAVVLLHTCLGLPEERRSIGKRIAAWGYVALFVDDFATRGLKETCAVDFHEALADAYGALAYLSRLLAVDPGRIAAVGFSQGGDTALKIATGGGAGLASGEGVGVQGRGGFLSSMRQRGRRDARHPNPHSRRREGRGDARRRLRAACKASDAGPSQVRGLSWRGPRLRPSRIWRRQADHGHVARL